MKKFAVVAIVIMVVLGIAWAQETGGARRGAGNRGAGVTEEQRNAMRERFANMSEEERAAARERMGAGRGFAGGGRPTVRLNKEDQLAAIKVIEEQTAKLKASIEGYERPDFSKMRDMSEEDRTKFREKMMKTFTERSQIITALQEKIAALSLRPPTPTLTREDIQELGAIQKLATDEKAPKTAARLQKLAAKFGRGRGGPRGGMGQPGQPGGAGAPGRRPARGPGAGTNN